MSISHMVTDPGKLKPCKELLDSVKMEIPDAAKNIAFETN